MVAQFSTGILAHFSISIYTYGYGAHHFWLKHRKLSNGEPKEYRLLKVEF